MAKHKLRPGDVVTLSPDAGWVKSLWEMVGQPLIVGEWLDRDCVSLFDADGNQIIWESDNNEYWTVEKRKRITSHCLIYDDFLTKVYQETARKQPQYQPFNQEIREET